jgi:LL-diaminopimelate aminotransferase
VFRKTKLLFINYPNNPTGAMAPPDFFEKCVRLATKHGFIVAHDAAYNEVYFGSRPGTLLQCKGAKDVGVEFHSFSKTFSMCGWRVGWVAGNASVVSALAALKSNLDSGVFVPIQAAASAALDTAEEETAQMRQVYARRAKILVDGLSKAGWPVQVPPATFYVWTRVPKGTDSMGFCRTLLEEANVVVTPGHGFGPSGEGYFRISLTVSDKRLEEAVERLGRIKCQW